MVDTIPSEREAAPRALPAGALVARAMGALAGRAGILVVSFAFAILVARMLDPARRGSFALLQATNGLTVVLANFAIGGAVIYHVGKGRVTAPRAVGAASVLAVLSGVAAAAVLIPAGLLLRPHLFPEVSPLLLSGAILLATPLLLREYVGGTLIALGRPGRYVVSHAAHPAVATVVLTTIVLAGTASLVAVVCGWAAGITLSGLTALAMSLTVVRRRPELEVADVLELGRFGARTYPALLARFLNLRLDQFLVRFLASAPVLGQYAVAVNVGELLIQIPVVLLWALSGAISSADRQRSGELVAEFCRWSLVVLALAATALAILTPVGLPLVFGARYRGAVGSVLLLLPGMICFAPATIIAEYFIVQRNRPGKAALIAGTSMVTSAILNFPLTPALGAAGASLASSISYAVMLLTAVVLFTADSGHSARDLFRVRRRDLSESLRAIRVQLRQRKPVR